MRDDPTNNVPDNIFSKLGVQLHRKDNHPLGILKNEIYNYFDTHYSNKFDKFDDLSPIVSVKEVSFLAHQFLLEEINNDLGERSFSFKDETRPIYGYL